MWAELWVMSENWRLLGGLSGTEGGETEKAQADQALNSGCEKRKPMPKTESNFGAKMSNEFSALYKSSFGIFWTY